MHIRKLANQSVCILGYGREGQATVRALEEYAEGCKITIADKNEEVNVGEHKSQLGEKWLKNLTKFDVLIKSPGIPPLPEFSEVQEKLTSSTQIFLDTVHEAGSTVIGVTGTKG